MSIQVVFLGLGLWAGVLPPSTSSQSITAVVFSIIMIAVSVGLTISSTSDYTDRVRIRQLGKLYQLEKKNGV